jgi:hypothetical protein
MKIFAIGYNKTGTTSLSKIMDNNNIFTAPQRPFECNLESYFYGNYSTYVEMVKNDYYEYSFFQDVPFSLPNFYKVLDEEFKNSKFILTVRDNEDQWYDSLIRFYKKGFPNFYNPKKINGYIYEGLLFKFLTKGYGSPKTNPYCESSLKKSYLEHIKNVQDYFKNREKDLLVINLKDDDLLLKLENFLQIKFINNEVPHLNRTI